MDGNYSPNIGCGDSYNQSILTSSQNTHVDSFIVGGESDSVIVYGQTRSQNTQVDSFVVNNQDGSYIVKNQDDSCIVNNQDDSFIVNNHDDSCIVTTQVDSYIEDQPPWYEPYVKDIWERVAVLRRIYATRELQ